MKKMIINILLGSVTLTMFGATSQAYRLSQRIVPTECIVNPGQTDESYLSEDACYNLLHPLILDPPIISPQPQGPSAPNTGFERKEFSEGGIFLVLLAAALIIGVYARRHTHRHLPK